MPHRKSTLPAFACVGDVVDLWPDTHGLSYSEANAEGRARAEQFLATLRRSDAPALLGHVVETMVNRGTFDGVEIGFFHVLCEALMRPPVREFVEVPDRGFMPGRKMGCLRVVGG